MPMHASSPYLQAPPEALWKKAVAVLPVAEVNPHMPSRLRLLPAQGIASAGSCFAQRISRALIERGYNYMLLEEGPSFLSPAARRELGYGIYSARYGNIYTAMQLYQTFERAFGRFTPQEPLWRNALGRVVDPFRSAVEPLGFASEEECLWDREAHLRATRRMFEELDVLIFTLGLTEAWRSTHDGAVFPNCPGSGLGGEFDTARHEFHNFTLAEVVAQLEGFWRALKAVNPKAQMILTVSPVPLMATFEPRHVLQATVYSKSLLRVACEQLVQAHDDMHYFASYEIVTATGDSAQYFEPDRRQVSDEAVAHVIRCFEQQFMGAQALQKVMPQAAAVQAQPGEAMCDEDKVMAALAEQMYR